MTGQHHRPVLQPSSSFDWIIGSDEAGAAQRLAQETSWALLDRVRSVADHEVVERVVGLARLVGQVEAMVQEGGDSAGFDAALWLAQWLREPVAALGGERPIDLLDTMEGQALVSATLARMESGAYA